MKTIAELAEQLGVDSRTVRRYVEHLRDLDIPVDSVRGRYGGYRLAPGYRMPPLMLTDEEALAVIWALLVADRSGSGPVSETAIQNAAAKVRRVVPALLGRRIEAVLAVVDFTSARESVRPVANEGDSGRGRGLFDLSEAARDRRPVSFDYTPRFGPQERREVHPYGVVAHRGLLYLSGLDVAKQVTRTFRLDRISGIRQLDGVFSSSSQREPFRPVLGPLPPDPSRVEVSVLVQADAERVWNHIPRVFASVTPLPDFRAEEVWVRVFLRVERLEWVAGRLAVMDRPFIIEHPPELAAAVQALAHRLVVASTTTPNGSAVPTPSTCADESSA
ncbi:WYL domain-containing protein [Amycolatopsis sp. RM579]|uniref:WYL domain-containing protein n=2 Tax=Amycolatopsis pithecellobii TaxID=664692 RepID=A0A6N7Z3V6_9PSEU|nr:WYL domain-containing protein [Amycolatopsis pithecellobii]